MDKDINRQLYALLGNPTLVDQWWNTPNRGFELKTPQEVWTTEQGPERVRRYVAQFLYGDYF